MIVIFDLDDTLYDERQFVESGFRAVAAMANRQWSLDEAQSLATLIRLLDTQGRGRLFDDWLSPFGLASNANIRKCITRYRLHKPDIHMPDAHRQLLQDLPASLYLVTDGNKVVQHNKVQALNIAQHFKRVFITHRFGVRHAKPSTYCFEKIKQAEKCDWQDMVYVGDNPAKDFVNLNKLGMRTIRVLTGVHKDIKARPGYDAAMRIDTLADLPSHVPT